MSRRQIPALVVIVALASALLGGCGTTVRVEPLIGDDEELLGYIDSAVPDLSAHPPAVAAHKAYDALVTKDWKSVWDMLSQETQKTLDELASRTGSAPNGQSALLQSFETGIPLQRDDGKELRIEPLRWLLVADLVWFQRTLDPEVEPEDSDTEAVLYAIDTNHNARTITLQRQDGVWRIHQPSLRFNDVAPLLSSAR